jgi:hypothetical protein
MTSPNFGNIVLKEDENGEFTACIVDVKGPYDNKEHVPISSWFLFFAHRKMRRRAARLLQRIQTFIPKPESPNF